MLRKNDISLKEAINELIDAYNLRERYNQEYLMSHWEQIMGKTIAKYTTDIYIKDKKMFLYISSAPLKNELFIMREKIVQRVNEELQTEVIKEVIIK